MYTIKLYNISMHPRNNELPAVRLVTMLSNWYSGATLLAILMNRHSKVVCNGESFPFSPQDDAQYDCSCGRHLEQCNFYKTVASHMRNSDGEHWNRELFCQLPKLSSNRLINTLLLSPKRDSAFREWVIEYFPAYKVQRNRFILAHNSFFRKALQYTGKEVYVDGTKSIRRVQLLAHSGCCNMKVIHLVRDGRAFCFSFLKNRGLSQDQAMEAAQSWIEYIRLVDAFTQANPNIQVLTLRYEDMCRDGENFFEKLHRFIGVSNEDVFHKAPQENHILGNRMRRNFQNTISEDISWKEQFDNKTKELITEAIKESLKRFGYN